VLTSRARDQNILIRSGRERIARPWGSGQEPEPYRRPCAAHGQGRSRQQLGDVAAISASQSPTRCSTRAEGHWQGAEEALTGASIAPSAKDEAPAAVVRAEGLWVEISAAATKVKIGPRQKMARLWRWRYSIRGRYQFSFAGRRRLEASIRRRHCLPQSQF
jgi:hypothetical protein